MLLFDVQRSCDHQAAVGDRCLNDTDRADVRLYIPPRLDFPINHDPHWNEDRAFNSVCGDFTLPSSAP